MEGQKRKQGSVDGEADGKRTTRARKNDNVAKTEKEPEDDEVEEFFAILRRIRVAVEYFEKGNGKGGRRRELTAMESSSRRKSPGEKEEGYTGLDLDLNADPDPDPDLVGEQHVE